MSEVANEWYVSRGGERFGPVTFQDLIDAAKEGRLEPRTDLVYGSGMATWTPAGDVKGVFDKCQLKAAAQAGRKAPSDSLADSGSYDCGPRATMLELPGAPRLGFFLGITVLPVLLMLGMAAATAELQKLVPADYAEFVPLIVFLVPILVLVITVKRFQNLAMSGWWTLGLLVPILNLWLNYRLFACPPGYAFTKQLDRTGKVLAVLFWLTVVASIALPVLMLAGMVGQMASSEEMQEWLEQLKAQVPAIPEQTQKAGQ